MERIDTYCPICRQFVTAGIVEGQEDSLVKGEPVTAFARIAHCPICDGDFCCLVEFLNERGKLAKLLAPNRHYSTLFRPYSRFITTMEGLRDSLKEAQTGISGRSKP